MTKGPDALNEAILNDKLSIFQFDALVDEVSWKDNELKKLISEERLRDKSAEKRAYLSVEANNKLERIWNETQFLLSYYNVI
jgi:phage-related minor tail protein